MFKVMVVVVQRSEYVRAQQQIPVWIVVAEPPGKAKLLD